MRADTPALPAGRRALDRDRRLRSGARVERASDPRRSAATRAGPWCAPPARPRRPGGRSGPHRRRRSLPRAPRAASGTRPPRRSTPVVAGKRGRRRSGRLRRAWTGRSGCRFHDVGDAGVGSPPPRVPPPRSRSRRPRRRASRARFASPIVDVSFENLDALRRPRRRRRGRGRPLRRSACTDERGAAAAARARPVTAPAWRAIVLAEVPAARVGLFRIPAVAGAARPYLAPTDLARRSPPPSSAGRRTSCSIAMSDGAWGTPRHLRDVLREAARTGRGGRGAVDLLLGRRSVAQPCPRAATAPRWAPTISPASPGCEAVAACDRARPLVPRLSRIRRGAPARPTTASARRSRWRRRASRAAAASRIAADDSSQATALAAAAAARVLAREPRAVARWSCARCWR